MCTVVGMNIKANISRNPHQEQSIGCKLQETCPQSSVVILESTLDSREREADMFPLMFLVGVVGLFLLLGIGAREFKRRSYGRDSGYSPWMYGDGGASSFGDSSGADCAPGDSGCGGGDGGGGGGGD
jgi:hypothetical protein